MTPTVFATVIVVAAVCLLFGMAMGGRVSAAALMMPCSLAAGVIGLLPVAIFIVEKLH